MSLLPCHKCKRTGRSGGGIPEVSIGMLKSMHEKNADGTYKETEWHWITCPDCHTQMSGPNFEDIAKSWNYWNSHFLFLDNAHEIALDAVEFIEARLAEYDIVLTEEQIDAIYVPLEAEIEKYSNQEYSNYN